MANRLPDQTPAVVVIRLGVLVWRGFGFSSFGLSFPTFFGFLESIALGLDLDDFGTMGESVHKGHGAGRVRKHFGPLAESLVGGHQDGLSGFVTARHDLEEQIGVAWAV